MMVSLAAARDAANSSRTSVRHRVYKYFMYFTPYRVVANDR